MRCKTLSLLFVQRLARGMEIFIAKYSSRLKKDIVQGYLDVKGSTYSLDKNVKSVVVAINVCLNRLIYIKTLMTKIWYIRVRIKLILLILDFVWYSYMLSIDISCQELVWDEGIRNQIQNFLNLHNMYWKIRDFTEKI